MTLDEFNKGYVDYVMSANPAASKSVLPIGNNLLTRDVLHSPESSNSENVEVKQVFWSAPYGLCLDRGNTLGYFNRLAALCVWSFSANLLAEKNKNLRLVTDNDGARLAFALRLPYAHVDGTLQSLTSSQQGTGYSESYARLMVLSLQQHTSPKTLLVGRDVLLFRFPSEKFFSSSTGIVSSGLANPSSWQKICYRETAQAVQELLSKKVPEALGFPWLSLMDWEHVNSSVIYYSNKEDARTNLNNVSRKLVMLVMSHGLSPETVNVLSDRCYWMHVNNQKLSKSQYIPSHRYADPQGVGDLGYVEITNRKVDVWYVSLLSRFQARFPAAYQQCLLVKDMKL